MYNKKKERNLRDHDRRTKPFLLTSSLIFLSMRNPVIRRIPAPSLHRSSLFRFVGWRFARASPCPCLSCGCGRSARITLVAASKKKICPLQPRSRGWVSRCLLGLSVMRRPHASLSAVWNRASVPVGVDASAATQCGACIVPYSMSTPPITDDTTFLRSPVPAAKRICHGCPVDWQADVQVAHAA